MKARWWFSLILLAVYLATFHVWLVLPRPGIITSGLLATILLAGLFARAVKLGYFLNPWDAFWHGSVILDIALEGLVVPLHLGHSFYLCALAFILVVGGYHAWLFRRADGRMPV